ncbi:2-dehydro-3-deoxygalactonokinase [Mesobacterium pallidum]|uniref:2-dehydro-3-deoxygalactonokinase n=1 Tax=Mesobacterium pallidum TaxID=2872037 RepID=UPI001EE15D0F|nr:2-dehydro-3-deoxygalactonokinase [Mesobacterium pallidum]
MSAGLAWIAVDWGTSALRAWGLDAGGSVVQSARSDRGMGQLAPEGFEPALLELVGDWLPEGIVTQVVVCGMAGARQGWVEAPYAAVPCAPTGDGVMQAPTRDPRLSVRILSGLSQAAPADVMRGEETQVAGLLATRPKFDGIVLLPGTHTKWVHVSAGEVVSFRSFMTGELFALLSTQSVLRHSLGAETPDLAAFDAAVAATLSRPERMAAELFSIRAADLLLGQPGGAAWGRLAGLLIGAELAATRAYWLGQQLAVLDNGAQADLYARALEAQGAVILREAAAAMTLAGLKAAHARLTEA